MLAFVNASNIKRFAKVGQKDVMKAGKGNDDY